MMDKTIAPKKADQNPAIPKPGTSQADRPRRAAFMTRAKRPMVRIVIGRAMR